MKQIKTRHKLIPAIIMLLVAAITMSTASYAWFTMSTKVDIQGIQLNVIAPANILIRETKTLPPYNEFVNVIETTQNPTKKLKPASSVDGVAFFIPNDETAGNVLASGALPETGEINTTSIPVTNEQDGYFAEYKFQLVNTGGSAVNIGLKDLQITAGGGNQQDTDILPAVRFAILSEGANVITGVGEDKIFASSDTATVYALSASGSYSGSSPTTTEAPARNKFDTGALFTLAANGVASAVADPYGMKDIIVRVWIEGQDTACKTTSANSTFKIQFALYIIP
ncbi:MAG TPA: hypothetical protein P5064_04195 [Clostridia bacterium]|nr:hypothetical protein [Clostridia bacterium]